MEVETAKILGSLSDSGVTPAPFVLSAQCNRVPVYDGHTESVSVRLGSNASVDQVIETLRTFSGMPQERKLPSAPEHPILVRDEPDRPQPARDLWHENGMATIIGRVRTCPILSVKMVLMGHNTVRGAAGAAILNAEAALELGYIDS
jgi:aspartate-semialdehyde dehydrogenase